jgi:hypothetical protein
MDLPGAVITAGCIKGKSDDFRSDDFRSLERELV